MILFFVKSAVLGRHLTLLCVTEAMWFHFCSSFHLQRQQKKKAQYNKYHRMMVIKTFSFNGLRLHYYYTHAIKASKTIMCHFDIFQTRAFMNDKIAFLYDLSFKVALCANAVYFLSLYCNIYNKDNRLICAI